MLKDLLRRKIPPKYLLITIFYLLIFSIYTYQVITYVDNNYGDTRLTIKLDVYDETFKTVNETSVKYQSLYDGLTKKINAAFNMNGFMYIAQPQTDWVLVSSYINILLYFNGYEARYFAGFSIPRIQFIIATLNFSELNLDEPMAGRGYVVIDNRYAGRSDPIFDVINSSQYFSLYYPGIIRLDINYSIIYLNTEGIRDRLGIPDEITYRDGKSKYDFRDNPPIYLLVDVETYVGILDLMDPITYGNVLDVSIRVENIPSLGGYVDKAVSLMTIVREICVNSGLDRFNLRILGLDPVIREVRAESIRLYTPYLLTQIVATMAIIIYSLLRIRRKRRFISWSPSFYNSLIITLVIITVYLVYKLSYYMDLLPIILSIALPIVSLVIVNYKSGL